VIIVSASPNQNDVGSTSSGGGIYKLTLKGGVSLGSTELIDPQFIGGGFNPTLFPDKTKLAFSNVDPTTKTTQIFESGIGGDNARMLTNTDGDKWNPTISPDGKDLLYTSREPKKQTSIYDLNLSTGKVAVVNKSFIAALYPSWIPDGSGVIFSGNDGNALHIVLSKNGEEKDITPMVDGGKITDPSYISVSPDGKKVAFVRLVSGQVYVMSIDGTNPVKLTNADNQTFSAPSWSPDNNYLIAVSLDKNQHRDYLVVVSMSAKVLTTLSPPGIGGFNMPRVLKP
jgi:TolB protein